MAKRRKRAQDRKEFLGSFDLPDGKSVVGELSLKGSKTSLKLNSDEFLPRLNNEMALHGRAFTGEVLTLIDCRSAGTGSTGFDDAPMRYHTRVFPHYVAVGRKALKPEQASIRSIEFSATDLATVFYDFDAFSTIRPSKSLMDAVMAERGVERPVETGERPLVSYYTGKGCIAEAQTTIGKISAHHCPGYSMGGPTGAHIKNRIIISVEPPEPITFDIAIQHLYDVGCFISTVAGRAQGIDDIRVNATLGSKERPALFSIYPSFRWKASGGKQYNPHPADVPLDPINHRDEFEAVLSHWMERHGDWRLARGRYMDCLRKANKYGPDRLVTAANMFDILPKEAVPASNKMSPELESTRDSCASMFRAHPASIPRDSALLMLSRLDQPSLPKKVAHRVAIIEAKLGHRFPELKWVGGLAVKCRNFLVHGGSVAEYERLVPLMPFLTDALEFIFAASDLIEAGWDAHRWSAKGHTAGHTFTRFRADYAPGLHELKLATSMPEKAP